MSFFTRQAESGHDCPHCGGDVQVTGTQNMLVAVPNSCAVRRRVIIEEEDQPVPVYRCLDEECASTWFEVDYRLMDEDDVGSFSRVADDIRAGGDYDG